MYYIILTFITLKNVKVLVLFGKKFAGLEIVRYSIIVWIKQMQRKCVTTAIQEVTEKEYIRK